MTSPRHAGLIIVALIASMLSGCRQRETAAQLQAWTDLQKPRAAAPAEQPANPPYQPFVYQADGAASPFGQPGAATAARFLARPAQRAAAQPLESYPLASIQMVGTISQAGRQRVLLQVEQLIYQAQTGDYLGQDFGVIRSISEQEISLEELIPGSDGRWEKRMTRLYLRGREK